MFRNLEAELKRKNVTQSELAKVLGISSNTISRKMNGESEFTLREVMKIKKTLGVSIPVEELFAVA